MRALFGFRAVFAGCISTFGKGFSSLFEGVGRGRRKAGFSIGLVVVGDTAVGGQGFIRLPHAVG